MEALVQFLLGFEGPAAYLFILGILLLCGLGAPVPEDIVLFAGGLLSYYGVTKVPIVIAVSLFGVLAGDSFLFWVGSRHGRRLARRWPFRLFLAEGTIDAVAERFHKRGNKLLFMARFMPGVRAPIFFTAGTLGVSFRTFILHDGSAALISVPTIVGVVYAFGDQVDHVVRLIRRVEHGILFAILLILALVVVKWLLGRRKAKRAAGEKAAPVEP